jgi:hypothetical protein
MWPGSPIGTGSRPASRLTGTAPLDASSGEQNRHRLSRAGNRRMNHMIHIAAVTQLRHDDEGRTYYRRKRAEGKKPMEAMRCLIGRVSRGRPSGLCVGNGEGRPRCLATRWPV